MTAITFMNEAQRWNAVVRRDREADGGFYYAVKTTGIFCRPSCASRLPNRENVVFFTAPDDAERAGFRACKRCRPNSAPAGPPGREAVVRACEMIEGAAEPPSLDELARAVGLSPYHFQRIFKKVVGVTPKGYAASVRVRRLREGLLQDGTVTGAIYGAGYGSSGRCYEGLPATLGMTPSEYRGGAEGLVIRHAIARCRLGWVLVAATGRGICMIEFDDAPEILHDRLATRFPKAIFRDGDPGFVAWMAGVLSFIDTPSRGLDLPLDIQGAAFQRRVWEALRTIPSGTTASYAEVADRIGRPSASRAVARACAANPIALAIPCHRVVRSDGHLSGYRWGVERKRALLDRESRPKHVEDE